MTHLFAFSRSPLLRLLRRSPTWVWVVLAAVVGPWAVATYLWWVMVALNTLVGVEFVLPRYYP